MLQRIIQQEQPRLEPLLHRTPHCIAIRAHT